MRPKEILTCSFEDPIDDSHSYRTGNSCCSEHEIYQCARANRHRDEGIQEPNSLAEDIE